MYNVSINLIIQSFWFCPLRRRVVVFLLRLFFYVLAIVIIFLYGKILPKGGVFMNYNNYGFPNFNPYAYPPQPQPQPQQTNQPQLNTNKIFVSGIDEVKMKMLPANSDYMFLDNDKNLLYVKTVDSSGHFTTNTFEINPYTAEKPKSEQFITKEQFDGLTAKYEALTAIVNSLTPKKSEE